MNYSLYLSSKKILYRGNSMRARAMRKTLRFQGGANASARRYDKRTGYGGAWNSHLSSPKAYERTSGSEVTGRDERQARWHDDP